MTKLHWHFVDNNGFLSHDCGHIAAKDGLELWLPNGERTMAGIRGFHGCVSLLDAVSFAPGHILCRRELLGRVDERLKFSIADGMRIVGKPINASRALLEFSCWAVELTFMLVDNVDKRSVAAVAAKRDWLDGKITDGEMSKFEYDAERAAEASSGGSEYDAADAAAYVASTEAGALFVTQAISKIVINLLAELSVKHLTEAAEEAAPGAEYELAVRKEQRAYSSAADAAYQMMNNKLESIISHYIWEPDGV